VDERYGLARQGFTAEAIRKLSLELGMCSAVAHVFSTRFKDSCHAEYSEIYVKLATRETTVKNFVKGNTKSGNKVKQLLTALLPDARPSFEEATAAMKAQYGQSSNTLETQKRHIQEAADTIARKVVTATRKEQEATRPDRVVVALGDRKALLGAESFGKIQAIVSNLEIELLDDSKFDLTLETCKQNAGPHFRFALQEKSTLTLTWIAEEEKPGFPFSYFYSRFAPQVCLFVCLCGGKGGGTPEEKDLMRGTDVVIHPLCIHPLCSLSY